MLKNISRKDLAIGICIIAAIIIILAIVGIKASGGTSTNSAEDLIGTWQREDAEMGFIFYSDGTLVQYEDWQESTGSYSAENGTLTMYDRYDATTVQFHISGDILTMTKDGDSIRLYRVR